MRGSVQDTRYLPNKSSSQNSEDRGEGGTNRKTQENFSGIMVQNGAEQNELKRTFPSHITVKFQNIRDKGRILIISGKPTHIQMCKNQNGIEFLNSNMVNLEDPRTKLSSL